MEPDRLPARSQRSAAQQAIALNRRKVHRKATARFNRTAIFFSPTTKRVARIKTTHGAANKKRPQSLQPTILEYVTLLCIEEESFTPMDIVQHRSILVGKHGKTPLSVFREAARNGYLELLGLDESGQMSANLIKIDFNCWLRRTSRGTLRMLAVRDYFLRLGAFVQDGLSIVCNPPYYEPDLGPWPR